MESTFDNPDKINPREARKQYRKHIFCKSQLSTEIPLHTLDAVLTSLPIFFCLLEVRISWNTSIFPKKTVFLTFLLAACKVQFRQPVWPLIALDHYFSLKVRKLFFVSWFFIKAPDWYLEPVKRSFGNPSEKFPRKVPIFYFRIRKCL